MTSVFKVGDVVEWKRPLQKSIFLLVKNIKDYFYYRVRSSGVLENPEELEVVPKMVLDTRGILYKESEVVKLLFF